MQDSMLTPYALKLADLMGQAIPEGYPFSKHGNAKPPSAKSAKPPSAKSTHQIPDTDRDAVKSIYEDEMRSGK